MNIQVGAEEREHAVRQREITLGDDIKSPHTLHISRERGGRSKRVEPREGEACHDEAISAQAGLIRENAAMDSGHRCGFVSGEWCGVSLVATASTN